MFPKTLSVASHFLIFILLTYITKILFVSKRNLALQTLYLLSKPMFDDTRFIMFAFVGRAILLSISSACRKTTRRHSLDGTFQVQKSNFSLHWNCVFTFLFCASSLVSLDHLLGSAFRYNVNCASCSDSFCLILAPLNHLPSWSRLACLSFLQI